jgi:hypothetical protein
MLTLPFTRRTMARVAVLRPEVNERAEVTGRDVPPFPVTVSVTE